MAVIALDVGGTKVASAIMENDGTIRFSHKNLLGGREGHDVGKLIVSNLSRQIEKAKYHKINIESIGVCIPGTVNLETGRVWAPNIPQWQNYPLKEVIRNSLGNPDIDIFIDNDRICYVYGEMWLGAARGCRNVIFVAVGTGIGAGIYKDADEAFSTLRHISTIEPDVKNRDAYLDAYNLWKQRLDTFVG